MHIHDQKKKEERIGTDTGARQNERKITNLYGSLFLKSCLYKQFNFLYLVKQIQRKKRFHFIFSLIYAL